MDSLINICASILSPIDCIIFHSDIYCFIDEAAGSIDAGILQAI